MGKSKIQKEKMNPDQVILNKVQQKRLAMLSGVDEKELSGKTIAQLSESLKWKIDLRYFLFEKICGKVVKKDPVTGVEYPVPFATVYVEDTDCNLIIYHPHGFPWSWHFPYFCHKEIIGTTKTDACGNFCVWVPRFDIDWILKWRKQRICFPIIFKRPILSDYLPKTTFPPVHGPGPDPGPLEELNRFSKSILGSIPANKAEILSKEIFRMKNRAGSVSISSSSENDLTQRLFDNEMPAPLSADFQKLLSDVNVVSSKKASVPDAIRTEIAERVGLGAAIKELEGFNVLNCRGPFYRCFDINIPVWQRIVDVPDITFRVTQDTNGDGVEETIYSEGYFDVRWDSGPISNVTLVASSNAKESHFCLIPDVPCGNIPALQLAGLMPLDNSSYFNATTGYTIRPNRPKPSGLASGASVSPAKTPFCGTLVFSGCVKVQNAKYYRILKSTDNGATFSAITGLSWNNYVSGGFPIPIVADSNGWYPVDPINPVTLTPVPRASLELPTLVFEWPTPELQKTILKIELGNNSKAHISDSANVAIMSDNTVPSINTTKLSWKYANESDSALRSILGIPCPMIKRGAVARDIEVVFEVNVHANHLRDASLGTSGCGDGAFVPVVSDPLNKPAHWHQTVFDNSVILYQRYSLNAASLPGCYTFSSFASSRSMNPSGADGGNLLPTDWFYNPVYIYSHPSLSVAVVNEDL